MRSGERAREITVGESDRQLRQLQSTDRGGEIVRKHGGRRELAQAILRPDLPGAGRTNKDFAGRGDRVARDNGQVLVTRCKPEERVRVEENSFHALPSPCPSHPCSSSAGSGSKNSGPILASPLNNPK